MALNVKFGDTMEKTHMNQRVFNEFSFSTVTWVDDPIFTFTKIFQLEVGGFQPPS